MSEIRDSVREFYSNVAEGAQAGCCAPSCCSPNTPDPTKIAINLGYSEELEGLPEGANLGLGCGNPTALAGLKPGEVVVDLGSGAGIDCFLAAKKVGLEGRVIGVDMTPTMISKARQNARKGDFQNVEFRLGEIEHLPIENDSVNVIISNCVVNLSDQKDQVWREAFRVLKSGGRVVISDVLAERPIPEHVVKDVLAHVSCLAGASEISEVKRMLQDAGFKNIRVDAKPESKEFIREWLPGSNLEDYVVSATIEATKP